jgi:hypothetical protein
MSRAQRVRHRRRRSFCDPDTATCTAGCANGSTESYTQMSHRCPVDEACQENGTCAARCWSNSGVSCNPTGDYICYWNGDEYPTYSTNNCRLPCSGDLDCPADQICTSFWIYWSDTEDICAKPCDVAGCWGTDSHDGNGSECACASDGFCHVGGDTSGALCRAEDGYYGR